MLIRRTKEFNARTERKFWFLIRILSLLQVTRGCGKQHTTTKPLLQKTNLFERIV